MQQFLSLPRTLLFAGTTLLILFVSCKKEKPSKKEDLAKLGTCQGVSLQGGMTSDNENNYRFESAGGSIIEIIRLSHGQTQVTIKSKSYPAFKYELWGGTGTVTDGVFSMQHENLNGKHLKDRVGASRSIIFPDGAKITCVATGPEDAVTAITIYDGDNIHHYNIICNKIEFSGTNSNVAARLDTEQADGETSTFEITTTGLIFYNIYDEATPGNKVSQRVELGELIISSPTQVNDYYDDPRISHT